MTRLFTKQRRPVLEAVGQIVVLLSLAGALAYGGGWYPDWPFMNLLMKGSAVGLLALFVLINIVNVNHVFLFVALAASTTGDILLATSHDAAFLRGMLGFAAAHVAYILLYLKNRMPVADLSRGRVRTAALMWALTGLSLFLFYPNLGSMLIPVSVYSLLLTLMVTVALFSRYSARLVGLGAVLFFISDGMIGASRFMEAPTYVGYLIWAAYYIGQLLMVLGVMLTDDRHTNFGTIRFD